MYFYSIFLIGLSQLEALVPANTDKMFNKPECKKCLPFIGFLASGTVAAGNNLISFYLFDLI